ncbi:MAG: FmdB family zinc ribbon protein [Bacillota bacterium]
MPTYDFACRDCGHRFTVTVPIKEKDNATCPECGAKNVRQDYSGHILVKAGAKAGSGSSDGGASDAGSSSGSCGFG